MTDPTAARLTYLPPPLSIEAPPALSAADMPRAAGRAREATEQRQPGSRQALAARVSSGIAQGQRSGDTRRQARPRLPASARPGLRPCKPSAPPLFLSEPMGQTVHKNWPHFAHQAMIGHCYLTSLDPLLRAAPSLHQLPSSFQLHGMASDPHPSH